MAVERERGPLKYRSAFDIIGPVMVGPSSSHTAGALRIARVARQLFGQEPTAVEFQLMGSFAETYRGHGTDRALVAGILGFSTDDLRLPESLEYAKQIGLQVILRLVHDTAYHPNTVRIVNRSQAQEATEVVGSSLGGGKIEIAEVDGFPVRLSGDRPGLILWHRDQPGFLAAVLGRLAQQNVNVARLTLDRTHRGAMALAAIELDEALAEPSTELWAPVQQLVIKHRWLTPV